MNVAIEPMITCHQALRWAAAAVCCVLTLEVQQAQAATGSDCITINYKESLPPLSLEPLTNGVRLRFAGNPSQKFTIERAANLTGPWTPITSRIAPDSTLLRYDDVNKPPGLLSIAHRTPILELFSPRISTR